MRLCRLHCHNNHPNTHHYEHNSSPHPNQHSSPTNAMPPKCKPPTCSGEANSISKTRKTATVKSAVAKKSSASTAVPKKRASRKLPSSSLPKTPAGTVTYPSPKFHEKQLLQRYVTGDVEVPPPSSVLQKIYNTTMSLGAIIAGTPNSKTGTPNSKTDATTGMMGFADNNIDDWLTTSDGKTMARMKGDKITPYRAVWVADLIKPVIFTTPGEFVFDFVCN